MHTRAPGTRPIGRRAVLRGAASLSLALPLRAIAQEPDPTQTRPRGKRGWKKLHFGVDRSGVIVAHAVTEPTADDATTGISLIEQGDGDIASVTADAAYDTIAFYEAACARGARVVVPPAKTASVSRRRPRSGARDRTITRVKRLGRRRWKKASGYQRQARVENAVFRYKSIIGDGLRARTPGGRQTETLLACNVLNRMTEFGRPASYSIGR